MQRFSACRRGEIHSIGTEYLTYSLDTDTLIRLEGADSCEEPVSKFLRPGHPVNDDARLFNFPFHAMQLSLPIY